MPSRAPTATISSARSRRCFPRSASASCEGGAAPPPFRQELRAPGDARRHRGRLAEGLEDDAVALGQLEQRVEAVLRLVGVELEAQAQVGEADRRGLVDAERAARVEVAFDQDGARAQL